MYKIKLSPYHKIFYNEWKLDPNSSKYNIVFDQTLSSNLDIPRLRNALHRFTKEHLLFNSHVVESNGNLTWMQNNLVSELECFDSAYYSEQNLYNYIKRPFQLETDSIYRLGVFETPDNEYRLIIVIHHIIMDAESGDKFVTAISRYYNDVSYKEELSLKAQVDLIKSMVDSLEASLKFNYEKYKQFWNNLLVTIEPPDLRFLRLSSNIPNSLLENKNYNQIQEIDFGFQPDEISKLSKISRKYGITPYMYSQAVFAFLLYRYTGQDKMVLSYPITIKEGVPLICGVRVNTNFIVYDFTQISNIEDLFIECRKFFKLLRSDNLKHSYYPVYDILEDVNKGLLDVAFGQTNLKNNKFSFMGTETLAINEDFNIDLSNKLTFEMEMQNQHLNYRVKYGILEIDETILKQFIYHYQKIFQKILSDLELGLTNKLLNTYQILDDKEYQQIVYDWNDTYVAYPKDKTIHQLFEEQVERTPDNIAVVYEDVQLTYNELNQRANQLAHYLVKRYKIKSDDVIAICLDRSEHMIISILAVLKSGCAYTPVDPKNPIERIKYILNDVNAIALLTNYSYRFALSDLNHITMLELVDSSAMQNVLASKSADNLTFKPLSSKLVYVIYTSGTTGNPKGVMVEHRNLVNYATYLTNEYCLDSSSIGSQYSGFGFDALGIEVFPMLLCGGRICIIKEDDKLNLPTINEFLIKHKVSYGFLPPQIAQMIFVLKNTSLKTLLVGGDKFQFYNKQVYEVINAYGPTEATIQSNAFVVDKAYDTVPVGKPINNVTNYILDINLNPMPIGSVGELYIGGVGVARGYLNNEKLTAERFIINHFQTDKERKSGYNDILYKTGDLCRFLPDGNVEFIGRYDSQIKIRGYRIELGEIESTLHNYPGIKQAIVLVKDSSGYGNVSDDKQIVAYYTASNILDKSEVQSYLTNKLPHYMLPSALIHVQDIPLTINGKVDEDKLLNDHFKYLEDTYYVPPTNEYESFICDAFFRVLNTKDKKIGINDDFFKIGGTSIQAINLTFTLKSKFDINITDLFNLRTPQNIAKKKYSGNDSLKQKLQQIKSAYENQNSITNKWSIIPESAVNVNYSLYDKYSLNNKKSISNIMLTGATGYLGCHLLNQLLVSTPYNIFILVRGSSKNEAFVRVNKKFKLYFGIDLDDYKNRIFIFNANIAENNLGLSLNDYTELYNKIDSIIHAAAYVKYYGKFSELYSVNVQATINLLEFTKLTKLKDFHYISTYSVLSFMPEKDPDNFYSEDDLPDVPGKYDNLYVYTKLLGEHQVIEYRNFGINGNIYRLGNLAFNNETQNAQENIDENAFFNWLNCILELKFIPREISCLEISPVDITANAIVKLFDIDELKNETYHIFNPNLFDLLNNTKSKIKSVSFCRFTDILIQKLSETPDNELVTKFLLRQGWIHESVNKILYPAKILQDKTNYILCQLGFIWMPINNDIFNCYIKKVKDKMTKKAKVIEELERIAKIIPSPIYWEDKNSIILGANDLAFSEVGVEGCVGKSLYELYPKEMADAIKQHNEEVMRTGKVLSQEEVIRDVTTGKEKYYIAVKSPLYDEDGTVIGIVGTSTNITAQKEAERLRYENRRLELQQQVNQAILEKESQFRKTVGQVSHDIRSPISSLMVFAKSSPNLPEDERVLLREAATRITDIANNLLAIYEPKENDKNQDEYKRESNLVSAVISQILSEKRSEYKELPIKFNQNLTQESHFAFINIESNHFKRMLSNLINNSVDALRNKSDGVVTIGLECDSDRLVLTIQDNGKGMPQEIINKIMNNIQVTVGKEKGSGIGFTQIRETLSKNEGVLNIDSTPGVGTFIRITFPRSAAPNWFSDEIVIYNDDLIVVLDDDPSIHGAWKTRFAADAPNFAVKHFEIGEEAIQFINNKSLEEKQKIFLLSDFELLNQPVNGLQVIEQTNLERSVLVTSHHNNKDVQDMAGKTNTKILPKLLAVEVPIKIKQRVVTSNQESEGCFKPIDVVMVDDDRSLIRNLTKYFLQNKRVDSYYNPIDFLDNIQYYSKDTVMVIDHEFSDYTMTGIDVIERLVKLGFKDLYLFSGKEVKGLPKEAKFILKGEVDDFKKKICQ